MRSIRHRISIIVAVAASGWAAGLAPAADDNKPAVPPRLQLPRTGQIRFERRDLVKNRNEGIAVADVNKDAIPDLTAGPFWFEGPAFKSHPLRDIALELNDEFMANNGEHAFDLNGDGWLDVIAGSWFGDRIWWFENPGPEGLAAGRKWKEHVLSTGKTETEGLLFEDLDGDGVPELVPDSWVDDKPVIVIRITPGRNGGEPRFTEVKISDGPNGHGMGIGDVNRDGRPDVVVQHGWYEAPEGDRWSKKWTFHRFEKGLGHTGLPILVVDVNGDGKNDLVYGQGHDFGLFWNEQIPGDGPEYQWKRHLIDDSFSQVHTLAWTDLDGDGNMEILTGKRFRAHGDGDPGAHEPVCLLRFEWDPAAGKFARDVISFNDGISTGMQIRVADLDGDKRPDVAVAGKSGGYVLLNRGPAKRENAAR